MITIEHCQGYVIGDFNMATDDFIYAIGQEKPNYPMPAIYDYLSTYRGYTLMLALHPANEIDPDREEWKLDPDYQ